MTNSFEHHLSKDGSSTVYSSKFQQYYHNPNGAVTESRYIFFESSGIIDQLEASLHPIHIFEVGFGTGLNFLLLLDEYISSNSNQPVHFYSVEAFPVDFETAQKFNFGRFLENSSLETLLPPIFQDLKPGENTSQPIPDKEVYLHVYYSRFDELKMLNHSIDFVFHDAFSPEVNDELWTIDTFKKIASFCTKDAILTTYCAASKARAAMASAGWFLGKKVGALGKREMTIASLKSEKLAGIKRINEQRLIERLKNGDFQE